MKIVTGHTGEDHVTSADFQALNQGVFGEGNYVMNVGNKFSATMPDATHVVITDGEGVMQGVHFRTERGSTDTVEIDAGATGVNRIDFVGALYEKDTQGVESVTWAIAKGTAVSGVPTEPTYATGDILAGDSPVFYPMFKITLTGVSPVIERLAEESTLSGQVFKYHDEKTFVATGSNDVLNFGDTVVVTLGKGIHVVTATFTVKYGLAQETHLSFDEGDGDHLPYGIGTDGTNVSNLSTVVTVTEDSKEFDVSRYGECQAPGVTTMNVYTETTIVAVKVG